MAADQTNLFEIDLIIDQYFANCSVPPSGIKKGGQQNYPPLTIRKMITRDAYSAEVRADTLLCLN